MNAPADLRSALLRAARDELAEGGLARVSLRAVARRAGVSHAAPGYAFGDRAGLLTAVVAEGFRSLAAELDAPIEGDAILATLGRRYLDFARRNAPLYDLMFRPEELHGDDAELAAARQASLRRLIVATGGVGGRPSEATLLSWAVAHGLATLGRQGALDVVAGVAVAQDLIDAHARLIERDAGSQTA